MDHYLYIEVEGIQRFVFASTKLKIIRGGSALLDSFNRVAMREAVGKKGRVVLAGGGHCLVRGLSRDDAEGIAKELDRKLRKKTDGQVGLSWSVVPKGAEWKTTWAELRRERAARDLVAPAAPPPLPPFVALCSSCGSSPARALRDTYDAQPRALCAACWARWQEVQKIRELKEQTIWSRLRPHLERHAHPGGDRAFSAQLPERELEQIAELGSRKGYLAYLYCDGNAMGRVLRAAKSDDEYGEISERVDSALHKAVAAALLAHCPPERNNGKFGAEVLLLGGDDLIVALPADRGVGFTQTVLSVFHREAGGACRLSAGLVLAPYTTPIAILQQVAGSLLRSAKRYAYLDEHRQIERRPVGYIDFQELTSAQVDVERDHAVTCRPYRIEDFGRLVERTSRLRQARVPRGRLYALAEAVRGSEREARTMTRLIVGRAKPGAQRAALLGLLRPLHDDGAPARPTPYTTGPDPEWDLPFELFPDSRRWSVLPDAIELLDHLPSDGDNA
ncbi:Cas10/Cmr2 second palm domain-containing protein [Sorangium sp. So ce513]|uniref:Cas10/Cmr2 second palm domain-containing protein n=1 Tax=Sorangium sp. So ce513 TaxID=3133315 RepID=UPI003F5E4339